MESEKRLLLNDVHGLGEDGITFLDGVDQQGKLWIFRRRSRNSCCLFCNKTIGDGWMRFDDGEIVCSEHVNFKGAVRKSG